MATGALPYNLEILGISKFIRSSMYRGAAGANACSQVFRERLGSTRALNGHVDTVTNFRGRAGF